MHCWSVSALVNTGNPRDMSSLSLLVTFTSVCRVMMVFMSLSQSFGCSVKDTVRVSVVRLDASLHVAQSLSIDVLVAGDLKLIELDQELESFPPG